MGDEDENNVQDTSVDEQSGVQLTWLRWQDIELLLLHARLELIQAISGMVS